MFDSWYRHIFFLPPHAIARILSTHVSVRNLIYPVHILLRAILLNAPFLPSPILPDIRLLDHKDKPKNTCLSKEEKGRPLGEAIRNCRLRKVDAGNTDAEMLGDS